MAIDDDFVTWCHVDPGRLQGSHLGLARVTRRRCASWDAQLTQRIGQNEGDNLAIGCLFDFAFESGGRRSAALRRSSIKTGARSKERYKQKRYYRRRMIVVNRYQMTTLRLFQMANRL
jgi:hypothetical protein